MSTSSPQDPTLRVLPDLDALAESAAQRVINALTDALERRDRASLVLTGGESPKPLYRLLATKHRDALDWNQVDIFFGDDRFVPPDDEKSNARMARETLLDPGPIPSCNVYPFPTTMEDPKEAAEAYQRTLEAYFAGKEPRFDVLLLGLGGDTHIASLFPDDDEALAERERWVIHTQAPEGQPVKNRVTMTYRLLNSAGTVLFLVSGEEKADAVHQSLNPGDELPPAARVQPQGQVVWFLDEAAAEKVEQ